MDRVDSISIEVDSSPALTGNVLTLRLHEPAEQLGDIADIVLTWSETSENLDAIENGAFRVLGDTLTGGNA